MRLARGAPQTAQYARPHFAGGPMRTRRRAHPISSYGAAAIAMALCVVLFGMANALASTVTPSQLVLAEQGGAATMVASKWTGTGACAGTAVKAGTNKEVTGTASLETAPGGGAEMVLAMHSSSQHITFTGPVDQAAGSQLTLDVRSSTTSPAYTATVTGSGATFTGTLTASANGCTLTSPGTLTLAGAGLTETTTTTISTTGLIDLGGLSVASYCQQVDHSTDELAKAVVGTDAAYDNWRCGTGPPLVMLALCDWTYSSQAIGIVAVATDPNNAESWTCFATALTATSTTIAQGTGSHGRSVQNPDVAPIASRLGTPGEVFHSFGHDLLVAVIAVAVMLFIAFPANIFNQTFQENYEEILGMIANARRRIRTALGLRTPEPEPEPESTAHGEKIAAPKPARPAWFVGTLVLGAILGGLLKPGFGFNTSSIEDFFAALFAFAFGSTISWYIARAFRRHHRYVHHTYLHALPLGIAIAAVCVVISRVTDFSPGYLYGIVVSIAWVESLSDRHNAHLTTISALSTLGVAIAAWLLWIPANHLALEPGSNGLEVLVDDTLASIFIAGLVGTVVNLLPLRGLPGGTILGWRRDAWAAVCFVAVFLLIEVELLPASGPTHAGGAPWVTAIVLFILFGGLSFGMREFFARRHREQADLGAVTMASPSPTSPPPDPG
jgi:hypothetical protein